MRSQTYNEKKSTHKNSHPVPFTNIQLLLFEFKQKNNDNEMIIHYQLVVFPNRLTIFYRN